MRFRLSKLACGDLDSIYARTLAQWGKPQADRYNGMLWDAFDKVAATPTRWRVQDHLYKDCRVCFAGRHAILYRIRDGRVEIGRVLHDAMDFRKHIPADFMGGE